LPELLALSVEFEGVERLEVVSIKFGMAMLRHGGLKNGDSATADGRSLRHSRDYQKPTDLWILWAL
jgi:hypothetical protein